MSLISLAENRYLPDWLIRIGIRRLAAERYRMARRLGPEAARSLADDFISDTRASELAVNTRDANDQHYEVPAEFFRLVLGPRLKYSCCLFPTGETTLDEAEEAMLDLTCRRVELSDGMDILELGCGWGSLTLWMAQHFPDSHITAVSNSHGQRHWIEARCRERGLDNVRVLTADMRDFEIDQQFDRVVSIEMFEHMRNYEELLRRISGWLHPDGKLFVHIFCHRSSPYLFETEGAKNWMGRHFFTGGMMPSDDLLLYFQNDLAIQQHWRVDGSHYRRTSEEWLRRQDRNYQRVLRVFLETAEPTEAKRMVQRWRMFFMACAETFGYRGGSEWFVSHYLFENRPAPVRRDRRRAEPITVAV